MKVFFPILFFSHCIRFLRHGSEDARFVHVLGQNQCWGADRNIARRTKSELNLFFTKRQFSILQTLFSTWQIIKRLSTK